MLTHTPSLAGAAQWQWHPATTRELQEGVPITEVLPMMDPAKKAKLVAAAIGNIVAGEMPVGEVGKVAADEAGLATDGFPVYNPVALAQTVRTAFTHTRPMPFHFDSFCALFRRGAGSCFPMLHMEPLDDHPCHLHPALVPHALHSLWMLLSHPPTRQSLLLLHPPTRQSSLSWSRCQGPRPTPSTRPR